MSTIEERVTVTVANFLGVKPEEVHPTSRMVDDLGADSLDFVELVMAIEGEFEVEIPDHQAEKFSTVQDFTAYLTALTDKTGQRALIA